MGGNAAAGAEPDGEAVPRVPLSRERVLRAAVRYADEHGVEALSMRKLARELGYEVMSLYNHVRSKDVLLDGMVDLVAGEIELPRGGPDWKGAIRHTVVSAHEALERHPWAGGLWSSRTPGPARLRQMDSLLGALHAAGLSAEATYRGFHAINTHVVGSTLHELRTPVSDEDLATAAAAYLRDFPAEQYPHVAEHIRQHVDDSVQGDSFGLVLDLILDGLEEIGASTP